MSSSPRSWRILRQPGKVTRALPAVAGRGSAAEEDAHVDEGVPSVERLVQAARREGFEAGKAEGLAEAAASVELARQKRAEQLAACIAEAAAKAATMRQEVVRDVGRDVAALVVELAEVLVGREVDGCRALRDRIVRALALAPEGPDLVVRVGTQAPLSDDEIRAIASSGVVDVVRDPMVDATGCVVTVGGCRIDAQVSTALDRVRRELEEGASR
jgi:flagellar biosynthesis/type III secretory pathway protein FliH